MLVCCVVNWDTMISVSKTIAVIINFLLIITGAVAIKKFYFNKIIFYRYHCSGIESSLQSCSNSTYTSSYSAEYWDNRPRAAVECQQMNINLTSKTLTCISSCITKMQSHVQWRVLLVL